MLNGEDISAAIRTPEMAMLASRVSALPMVRKRLTELQRQIGSRGEVVAEGRDMGTVVFPAAAHKFFLDASPEERARRRVAQLRAQGQQVDEREILAQIIERDRADSSRALAPLKPADRRGDRRFLPAGHRRGGSLHAAGSSVMPIDRS